MKQNFRIVTLLLSFSLSLVCLIGFSSQAYSQSSKALSINPINEWEATEISNAFIVTGKHKLSEDAHVWIFLKDRFNNFYLQYPPVEFLDETTWEATNVVIKDNVRSLWAVQVAAEGNKKLLGLFNQMKQEDKWGSIQMDYLESLPGYGKLNQITIDYDKLPGSIKQPTKSEVELPDVSALPQKPVRTSQNTDDQAFLITDFEKGEGEGKVQQWNHPADVAVETGYKKLSSPSKNNGSYAAFAKLPLNKKKVKDGWSGGGLVILMNKDESCIDVSNYQYLKFDISITKDSNLNNTFIKFEDDTKGPWAEQPISDYGVKLSTNWATVKIPLAEFTNLSSKEKKRWRMVNLSKVKKLVTVSILDSSHKNTQGTLFIDNIKFVQ